MQLVIFAGSILFFSRCVVILLLLCFAGACGCGLWLQSYADVTLPVPFLVLFDWNQVKPRNSLSVESRSAVQLGRISSNSNTTGEHLNESETLLKTQ